MPSRLWEARLAANAETLNAPKLKRRPGAGLPKQRQCLAASVKGAPPRRQSNANAEPLLREARLAANAETLTAPKLKLRPGARLPHRAQIHKIKNQKS